MNILHLENSDSFDLTFEASLTLLLDDDPKVRFGLSLFVLEITTRYLVHSDFGLGPRAHAVDL